MSLSSALVLRQNLRQQVTLHSSSYKFCAPCDTSSPIGDQETFLPAPSPCPPLGCHRTLDLSSLHHIASSHWLPILPMVKCMFPSFFLAFLPPSFSHFPYFHPLLPPLCPQVCSQHLCLHHCRDRFLKGSQLQKFYALLVPGTLA